MVVKVNAIAIRIVLPVMDVTLMWSHQPSESFRPLPVPGDVRSCSRATLSVVDVGAAVTQKVAFQSEF